jgi:hypothetical protein
VPGTNGEQNGAISTGRISCFRNSGEGRFDWPQDWSERLYKKMEGEKPACHKFRRGSEAI